MVRWFFILHINYHGHNFFEATHFTINDRARMWLEKNNLSQGTVRSAVPFGDEEILANG